jgi:molybdopterin synthase catalytic subunit
VTRSRASAKAAGTRFETSIANHLAAELDDDRIERRARTGAKDRGDIGGVRTPAGGRLVIECKDYRGQIKASQWMAEAQAEAGNDDAAAGVVVAKRIGTTNPGDQWVLMTVTELVTLLRAGIR